jgi:hypothetical protein
MEKKSSGFSKLYLLVISSNTPDLDLKSGIPADVLIPAPVKKRIFLTRKLNFKYNKFKIRNYIYFA